MNEMYEYLKEHAYVSENKHSNYQFELTKERAECIVNKHNNLIKDLQQENKQLKERIEYLERSNNRREDTILEQRQKISDLEDNWNKLKKQEIDRFNESQDVQFLDVLQDMQELEQGSGGNE